MGQYNSRYNRGQRNYQRRENFGGRQATYDEDYSYNSIKKSGAHYTQIREGKNEGLYAVNAWRKTKMGLMTAKAFPANREVVYTSKEGNEFITYAVEISNTTLGTSQTYWALMNKKTRKLFIKELGLVISPNGSGITSGGRRVAGYFGKAYGK